ncbi:MAG: serine/threonine-protein kinase [Verrucomicrobiota bacterium]|nr:serine/threonine-protein kinase [Verrucomicrobiota bacterium]
MPEIRATKVAELVLSAIEREPQDWPSFLEEACGSDLALRAEVESLLEFQRPARAFMQEPAVHLMASILVPDQEMKVRGEIGDYHILSKIGAGGMGDVYLAEDSKLGRKVALKLVRAATGTDSIVARFRNEERILASLNDPNIAQLYGGGVTTNDIPFFVMEYVEGLRIDKYCEKHALDITSRLQLFRKVCSAVHYAHQHLVIHRDLKPSNILVTHSGEPKLLDFGIAKLLEEEEVASPVTLSGAMTPDYASPEQVRGDAITTASDVYSLGVILYEILTGHSPYRPKSRDPIEIARVIAEQEPLRPSTSTARSDERTPPAVARNPRFLKGDLDNIVLMALRKVPARRYLSVAQFSDDIRRHLDGRPVIARKDTFSYRVSKFTVRNKVAVGAAVLVCCAIVAGLAVSIREAQVARKQKAKAESINVFLEEMLNYSNPILNLPRNNSRQSTMTDVLDATAKRLASGEFSTQPEIRAELERIIGFNYFEQGKADLGKKHLYEYVGLQYQLYGEADRRSLLASHIRASLLFSEGKIAESEALYREILPRMRQEQRRGTIKPYDLVNAVNNFAYVRRTQGDSKEAEALFRESLALSRQLPDESRYLIIGVTRSTLASTLADQGRFEEAIQTSKEAVAEYRQRRQTDTPDFAFASTVLGGFLAEEGSYAEADANLAGAEAIYRKLLEPSSLWLGDNLRNQALSLYHQDRYAEALSKVAEALAIYRESFGPHYDNYPTALIVEGLSLVRTGRSQEGEKVLREAVEIRTASLPKEHYWVAVAESALGECLTIEARFAEAEPLLLVSYESLRRSQGESSPRTTLALRRLIRVYEKLGNTTKLDELRAKIP